MNIKKYNGKVFGANLTVQQKQAMEIEIHRQLAETDKKYAADMDALVLYTLMAHYGWKKKRLKKFWKAFIAEHKNLRELYRAFQPGDSEYLAHMKLAEIGVDVREWYKEECDIG